MDLNQLTASNYVRTDGKLSNISHLHMPEQIQKSLKTAQFLST